MKVWNNQKFEIKSQSLLMWIFVGITSTVLADHPMNFMSEHLLVETTISANNLPPDTNNVFDIAKEVSQIFSEAVEYTSIDNFHGDTAYLDALFTSNYATNELANAYKNDVTARIKSQKGDLGVDFRADYSENFKPGFSPDEDIYYKRRFYFGIEWNVIKGGFLESRAKASQLESEYSLKNIDARKRNDAENYRAIFNYINFLFNKQKIEVLHDRYVFIDKQLKFTTDLYHLRYVGWENVLRIRAKLEDINQQIAQLESFNEFIPSSIPEALLGSKFSAKDLPLVDIDLRKLMQIYHNNATTDSIAAIKMAMFSDGMKWWQDISLKPYLRYNVYIDPLDQSRRFGAGGVSLSVPLRFKNKENLVLAKEAVYLAEGKAEFQAGDNELVNHYAEFAFKLKQIKEFYYKKLFADELIRKELVKMDLHDIAFNPIYTLGLIDDKKNIEAEIIDIKKRLYIQLVQIAFYLDQKSPMDFVEILNPNDFTSRYTTGVQIFVDDDAFQSMENTELVNYLWKNEFRDVILEIDSWTLSPKTKDLIGKASRNHLYFTLNTRLQSKYPDVTADFQKISMINNPYVNGLHYNQFIKGNSEIDMQEIDFSNWLDGIDLGLKPKNIRLSISIPNDLSVEILKKVYSKFDLVFIPSDGAPNRKNIEDKLIQEFSLGKDKSTIILNANDFANRSHIENFMENLNREIGVENFAISNVKNMINADLRTFGMGEDGGLASGDVMASFRNQIFSDSEKNKEIGKAQELSILPVKQEHRKSAEPYVNQELSLNNSGPSNQETHEVTALNSYKKPSQSWQIEIAASKETLTDQFLEDKYQIKESIKTYLVDGYTIYTIGNYYKEDEARAALENYKTQSGNNSAFVVSYQ